jgi:hypothetical protein
VTQRTPPGRDEVVALLASYGNRRPEDIGEDIDSLELAWLVHAVEERYGVELDVDDETLLEMTTVDGAVEVIRGALSAADGAAAGSGA